VVAIRSSSFSSERSFAILSRTSSRWATEIVRLVAGHAGRIGSRQRADILDHEAEIARMLDEGEPLGMAPAIAALVALGAFRQRQKPDLLVIADGFDLDPVRSASAPIGITRSSLPAAVIASPQEAIVPMASE
jgi:hypothetical protein